MSEMRASKLQKAVDLLVHTIVELRRADDDGDDTGLYLGDLILREREAWGLSLQALATASGLSKAHVWELETARTDNPRVKTLLALAVALRLPPAQIFSAAERTIATGPRAITGEK